MLLVVLCYRLMTVVRENWTFPFTIVKTKLNENVPLQNEDHDIKTGEEAKNGRDNDDDVLLLRSPFAKDRKKSPKQNQSKSLSKQIITSR